MSITDPTRTSPPEADQPVPSQRIPDPAPPVESVWGAPPPPAGTLPAETVGAGSASGRRRLPEMVRTKVAALLAAAGPPGMTGQGQQGTTQQSQSGATQQGTTQQGTVPGSTTT